MSAPRYRVVRVEAGAQCLAVQHKDAPAVLGLGKTSFEKYVVPEVRCVRLGAMRLYPVTELERWLDRNAHLALPERTMAATSNGPAPPERPGPGTTIGGRDARAA